MSERSPEVVAMLQRINAAWHEEGSLGRLGLRPAPSRDIQQELIPPGGDWQCTAAPGAVTRSIFWNGIEAALINPRGDLNDAIEGDIAMGIMDKALRTIFALAYRPTDDSKKIPPDEALALIAKIARAAIGYVERPAPRIQEPDEDNEETDDEEVGF